MATNARTEEDVDRLATPEALLLEKAWGVIANAGGWPHSEGGESPRSPGWATAAEAWRDQYHEWLGLQVMSEPELLTGHEIGRRLDAGARDLFVQFNTDGDTTWVRAYRQTDEGLVDGAWWIENVGSIAVNARRISGTPVVDRDMWTPPNEDLHELDGIVDEDRLPSTGSEDRVTSQAGYAVLTDEARAIFDAQDAKRDRAADPLDAMPEGVTVDKVAVAVTAGATTITTVNGFSWPGGIVSDFGAFIVGDGIPERTMIERWTSRDVAVMNAPAEATQVVEVFLARVQQPLGSSQMWDRVHDALHERRGELRVLAGQP